MAEGGPLHEKQEKTTMPHRHSPGPPVAPFIGFVVLAFLAFIVLPYVVTH